MRSSQAIGSILCCLACLIGGGGAGAAEVTPPWLEEDVMRAAMDIEMSDAQRSQFAAALRTFMEDYQVAVDKTLRRSNVADPAGQIERKRESLAGRMDRSVREILTQTQMPRYVEYRALLMSKLDDDVDRYLGISSDDDVHIGPTATH